jgi:glycosyltransferase involved in cell wall biosynthesis
MPNLALSSAEPTVAILLATYQGQDFLTEQLNSLESQTHANWQLWASDDGSNDNTLQILHRYQQQWPRGRLSIQKGPGKGFVANFLSLICDSKISADYFSYADQDDIWEKDKLASALCWLESVPQEVPALYCSRTRLVDEQNNEIGLSPLFSKRPSFANALMQNLGGGNTMVLNRAARNLIKEAGQDLVLNKHDWWTYLVVSGCGGQVFYDPTPHIRYRQHGNNQVGMNQDWGARRNRIKMLWHGRFKTLNDQHIAALETLQHRLTEKNALILQRFITARKAKLMSRLVNIVQSGVYRQTLLGNLGLAAAAVFGRL